MGSAALSAALHPWQKRHPIRHLADRLTTGRPSRASRGILRGVLWASVFWVVIIGGAVAWMVAR